MPATGTLQSVAPMRHLRHRGRGLGPLLQKSRLHRADSAAYSAFRVKQTILATACPALEWAEFGMIRTAGRARIKSPGASHPGLGPAPAGSVRAALAGVS